MNFKVNFFASIYNRETARNDINFGINDAIEEKDHQGMAYTTTDKNNEGWNAVVDNPEGKEVIFTPLDHNIVIHPKTGEILSLCDGMLHHSEWIAFVELKVVDKNWIEKSISQLQSAISLFCANHDHLKYRFREAYAANRKHPCFHYSHKVQMNEFHSKTHFRLLIQNRITVK